MKILLAAAAALLLALPTAAAWGGSVIPGKYEVAISSAIPELDGKKAQGEVALQGADNFLKVAFPDGTWEEWIWNDKTLTQKEFNKAGRIVRQYSATNHDGKYQINCVDRVTNNCDAGIDWRQSWTIDVAPDAITFEAYGVSRDQRNNFAAQAEKLHSLAFRPERAPAATAAAAGRADADALSLNTERAREASAESRKGKK